MRPVAFLLVALGFGLGAWLLLESGSPPPPAGTGQTAPRSTPPRPELPGARQPARGAGTTPRQAAGERPPARPVAPPPRAKAPAAAATWRGRVTDYAGRPLAGATVTVRERETVLFGLQRRGREVARGQTDRDGFFALQAGPAGTYELEVRHPAHPPLVRYPVTLAGPRDLGVLALPQGARVRGSVRGADGRPAAGVPVRLEPEAPSLLLPAKRAAPPQTDAQGAFRLGPVAPGRYVLRVDAPGHAPYRQSLELGPGADVGPLLIQLQEGLPLTGLVVDDTGLPVPEVTVEALGPATATTRTDAAGRFRFPHLLPGEYVLAFAREGYGRSPFLGGGGPVRARAGGPPVRVQLVRLAGVAGRVVAAATGEPLGAFVLRWRRPGEPVLGERRFQGRAGTFRLTGLEPGPLLLEALAPGAAPGRLGPLVLPPGVVVSGQEIRLPVGGTVTGRVVDGRGRPVAGAAVLALPGEESSGDAVVAGEDRAPPNLLRRGRTDRAGRFRVAHLLGPVVLEVRANGFAPQRLAVTVGEGTRLDVGEVTLLEGGTVRGWVRRRDGRPDPAAEVWLRGPGGLSRRKGTDENGAFLFEHLPPGEYELRLTRHEGRVTAALLLQLAREGLKVTVADGQVVTVELPGGGK